MSVTKRIKPSININFTKSNHAVRLNYAQVESVVSRIVFDPDFLKALKKSMECV